MATVNPPSIITLNVNGLNSPIKRHRIAEWIKNQDTYKNQKIHFSGSANTKVDIRSKRLLSLETKRMIT